MKKQTETPEQTLAKWAKRLPFLLLLIFIFPCIGTVGRPPWFDEVLTLDWTAYPLAEIPFQYQIPNNHIVFSLFLTCWNDLISVLGLPFWCLRLLPMLFGLAAVRMLYAREKRCGRILAGSICTVLLIASGVFRQFGTALRGYMPGLVFTLAAWLAAESFLKRRRKRDLLLYALFCYLSVGTLPSDLGALGGCVVLLLPSLFRKPEESAGKRCGLFLLIAGIPVLALVLFYLPVAEKFLNAARLPEGWFSRGQTIWNLYGTLFLVYLPVLPFVLSGGIRLFRRFRKIRFRLVCMLFCLLLPGVFTFFFLHPPFPRLFFPWLAFAGIVFAFCLSGVPRKGRIAAIVLGLLWIAAGQLCTETLSDAFFRKDDLLLPEHMRENFVPHKIVKFLNERYERGERGCIFVDFDADPPSLKLLLVNTEVIPETQFLYDVPNEEALRHLPPGTVIVCENEEKLQKLLRRFELGGTWMRIDPIRPSRQKVYARSSD